MTTGNINSAQATDGACIGRAASLSPPAEVEDDVLELVEVPLELLLPVDGTVAVAALVVVETLLADVPVELGVMTEDDDELSLMVLVDHSDKESLVRTWVQEQRTYDESDMEIRVEYTLVGNSTVSVFVFCALTARSTPTVTSTTIPCAMRIVFDV
ncbi:hypothetical protein BD626DRAFT_540090 [Schizophyllum amplum]|uniref:Uncharacterized protein n=1 Tax=Schizophyllum amplum TaxID=97359 RepID=A0A550C0H2_9AGAR|nr:hypothetical protein BD626DRAFT_540090 [Auriculariopsis ampla]